MAKDAPRVEAVGTIDELETVLGLARSEGLPPEIDALVLRLQRELFEVAAELAAPDPAARQLRAIDDARVASLEAAIDTHQAGLPPLDHFLLPGGVRPAALLHLARAVCRRAERRLVALARQEGSERISPVLKRYLNRLGDLLFILARATNRAAGQAETIWPGKAGK